jgi:Domain of unknown function (DUF4112)
MITITATPAFDRAASIARVKRIARLMDVAWRIPGTKIRFGADSVIGLVPGAGDLVTMGISLYMLAEAHRLGIPKPILLKMAGNIAIDTGIGAIPFVGDVFDMFFKSNSKNARLLVDHLDSIRAKTG